MNDLRAVHHKTHDLSLKTVFFQYISAKILKNFMKERKQGFSIFFALFEAAGGSYPEGGDISQLILEHFPPKQPWKDGLTI